MKSPKSTNYRVYSIVLIIAIAIGVYIVLEPQRNPSFKADKSCLAEKQAKYSNFIQGQILVIFNGNTEQLESKIDYYGLSMLLVRADSARVSVPIGEELQWICILEKETPLILRAEPNYNVGTGNPGLIR